MSAVRSSLLIFLAFSLAGQGCKKPRPAKQETPEREPSTPAAKLKALDPTPATRTRTADPAMVAQLGEEVEVEGYRIRPPKGYTAKRMQGGHTAMVATAWIGTPHPDESSPTLVLGVGTIPEGQRLPMGEAALAEFLEGIRRRRTDWSRTPAERYMIGGLAFFRAEWRGKEATTGKPIRGFLYIANDGRKVIQLSSQDFEPYDQTSLPLAEAGALTFRKSDKNTPR